MLDARNKVANCKDCKKLPHEGKGKLHLPKKGGKWDTPDGKSPKNGTGTFKFNEPKTLPDGRKIKSIDFVGGEPDFSKYAQGNKKYNL